jgi:hypothetical protein
MRQFDDRSFTRAAADSRAFRASTLPVELGDDNATITLPPFAVATLTADIETA